MAKACGLRWEEEKSNQLCGQGLRVGIGEKTIRFCGQGLRVEIGEKQSVVWPRLEGWVGKGRQGVGFLLFLVWPAGVFLMVGMGVGVGGCCVATGWCV